MADRDVHGGEASFSRCVKRLAAGDRWLGALPLFAMREFRDGNFNVRHDSRPTTIAEPAGRRVGMDGANSGIPQARDPDSGFAEFEALVRPTGP
jgi:hypothetical protein